MEDAGLTRDTLFRGDADPAQRLAGVFVGVMYGDYQLFGPEEAARGNLIAPNAAYWNVANRVSHFLDLHGPSMAIDTACSSSLTAIHTACAALRNGDCTVAFAGGVNLTVHPGKHWILSKSGFASSDGRCRSFGAGGDGYVPGEGIGAVLLKPLARARADGDRIHAIIRSSAVNHGGRTSGYTVPNPVAQGNLVAAALRARTSPPTASPMSRRTAPAPRSAIRSRSRGLRVRSRAWRRRACRSARSSRTSAISNRPPVSRR